MPILIEGLSPDELLALPDAELDALVFHGEPVAFRVGSAEVLGRFRRTPDRLVVELAQVEGGGEGVLATLWLAASRYARWRGLAEVEWIVHAVDCARPNPRLRLVLDRKGFVVADVPGSGRACHLVRRLPGPAEAQRPTS